MLQVARARSAGSASASSLKDLNAAAAAADAGEQDTNNMDMAVFLRLLCCHDNIPLAVTCLLSGDWEGAVDWMLHRAACQPPSLFVLP